MILTTFKYTNEKLKSLPRSVLVMPVSRVSCFSLWLPCLSHPLTPLSLLVLIHPHTHRALSSPSFPNSPLFPGKSHLPPFCHHPLRVISVAYSIKPSLTRSSPNCDAFPPKISNSTTYNLNTPSLSPLSQPLATKLWELYIIPKYLKYCHAWDKWNRTLCKWREESLRYLW